MTPLESSESQATQVFTAGRFAPPDVRELSSKLPNLDVLEFLGHGGMGAVYKGRQPLLERTVAIKVLRPDFKNNADLRGRFLQEARALARLRHPYVVSVYDIGLTSDFAYLVMEFVEGVTLRKRLSDGAVAERDALDFVPQLCEALEHAHDSGVVHRDVKPENVVLDPSGRVRLVDFGLASLAGTSSTVADDKVVGTLGYMAPEQILTPQSVDHRADIYSLGVVLYETLTGRLPGADRPSPSVVAGADQRLDRVVERATDRDREMRYQQMRGMRTDLVEVSRAPQSTIVVEQEIRASMDRVFAAWTEPAEMIKWFAPNDEYSTPIAEVDPQIGGEYRVGMLPPGEDSVRIMAGQLCRLEPPACLSFTWAWQPPHGDRTETQVTIELEPRGDSTRVVLTHERFRDQEMRDKHAEGWAGCLNRLGQKLTR